MAELRESTTVATDLSCSDCVSSQRICGHCHKTVCQTHTWKECSRCKKPTCNNCHSSANVAHGSPEGQLQCAHCGQPRCDSCSMRCHKCKHRVCWYPPNQQNLTQGCLSDKCNSCHRQFCKACKDGAASFQTASATVEGCPECGKAFKKAD